MSDARHCTECIREARGEIAARACDHCDPREHKACKDHSDRPRDGVRCPTCNLPGPDSFETDLDTGMTEAACGDPWHDTSRRRRPMPATSFYCPACGEWQAFPAEAHMVDLSPGAEAKVTCPCGTKWRITVEYHENEEQAPYDCPIHGLQDGPECARC